MRWQLCWTLAFGALLASPAHSQIRIGGPQKLTAEDGISQDMFGISVSVSGNRLLVGAMGNDQGADSAGAVYVYERPSINGKWTQSAKLQPHDMQAFHGFGISVCLFQDLALVGAFSDSQLGSNAGAAYLFERQSDGSWLETAKLLANDGGEWDRFGCTVSIEGRRILVGAAWNKGLGDLAGAAYVFEEQMDGSWRQTAKLAGNDTQAGDLFGRSVSISGERALIGAWGDDHYTGSAYIFERQSDGSWAQKDKLMGNDSASDDSFGRDVSLCGNRALIGASSNGPRVTGAAYIFEPDATGSWNQVAKLQSNDKSGEQYFGWSISLSSDQALIGAVGDDNDHGISAGAAYLFQRLADGSWKQLKKIMAADGTPYADFGLSVSLSGGTALIGAMYDDEIGSNGGAAYAFGLPALIGAR